LNQKITLSINIRIRLTVNKMSKTAKKFKKSAKNIPKKKDIRNISFKAINDNYSWGNY
jgi:hypothetical protein